MHLTVTWVGPEVKLTLQDECGGSLMALCQRSNYLTTLHQQALDREVKRMFHMQNPLLQGLAWLRNRRNQSIPRIPSSVTSLTKGIAYSL